MLYLNFEQKIERGIKKMGHNFCKYPKFGYSIKNRAKVQGSKFYPKLYLSPGLAEAAKLCRHIPP